MIGVKANSAGHGAGSSNTRTSRKLALTLAGVAAIGLGVSVASISASAESTSPDSHGEKAAAAHSDPHWSYEGASGPEYWAGISSEFGTCGAGRTQSPVNVDVDGTVGSSGDDLRFDYRPTRLEILHNGHTVQVNYAPGSSISLGGRKYELKQFHFHTPSEHAIDGQRAAMEVHFVHANGQGELAVVGVMIDIGAENLALGEIWSYMQRQKHSPRHYDRVVVNARDLLPASRKHYRYSGSLTTPPCSEGVRWHLMAEPVTVSKAQAQRFMTAVGENARPLQAVNGRALQRR